MLRVVVYCVEDIDQNPEKNPIEISRSVSL
jgi:hypothetical protein